MEMNKSGIESCALMCCNQNGIHKSPCYWYTYFLATRILKPDVDCIYNISIPDSSFGKMFSLCEKPDDVYLENDLYTLLALELNVMNVSTYNRLVQRIGTGDFNCTLSQIIADETKDIVAVCGSMFDLSLPSAFDCVLTASKLYNGRLFDSIITFLSLPCLASTFLIYSILPELRNLHGFILRSFIASVFFCSIFEIMSKIEFEDLYRLIIVLSLGYSAVATLLWLNVMSFDLWWNFRSPRATSKKRNRKKVTIYSIYAWGVPAPFVGFYSYYVLTGPIAELYANVTFLYGPVTVTTIVNVCFFVLTAVEITRREKDAAQQLEHNDSRRHNGKKQRFKVYLKLFTIMGVARIATWTLRWFQNYFPRCLWMAYITQALQVPAMMQGIFIFVTFVCNQKIKRLLSKRLEGSWFGTTF